MRWLMRWQHVAGSQVVGQRGTLEVLQQMQGFEIPANAWGVKFGATDCRLRSGVAGSTPDGRCGMGRLSPHPATVDAEERRTQTVRRRMRPRPGSGV
jgi:ATP-dependent Lhr-like helicase